MLYDFDQLCLSVVQDVESFYDLGKEWAPLVRSADHPAIFLSWEWMYHWWMVYGEGKHRLFLLTVRSGGRLVGLAPLYIKKNLLGGKEIRFLGSNEVCSDYLDFLLAPDHRNAALQAMLLFLAGHASSSWDKIDLADIPATSRTFPAVEDFFRSYPLRKSVRHTVCPYLDLKGGWNEVASQLASPLRNTIKRKSKSLTKKHRAEFVDLDTGEDLAENFDVFVRLNKLRMAARDIRSPFLDEDFLKFHKRAFIELHRAGMATLHFLTVDGMPIAGIYLFRDPERYYFYQAGFDPVWEKYSPGTLLLEHAALSAHAYGAKEFDFLRGEEGYKNSWTIQKRINSRLTIYSNKMMGRLFYYLEYLLDSIRLTLRHIQHILLQKCKDFFGFLRAKYFCAT